MKTSKPTTTQPSTHRQFTGVVLRTLETKTIRVRVETVMTHPKYRKQYTKQNTFPVHDENAKAKVGDIVVFEECRPLSKTKRWRLVSIQKSA